MNNRRPKKSPRREDKKFSRRPRASEGARLISRPRQEPKREVRREVEDTPALVGRHPVLEALRAGRGITRIWIQEGLKEGSLREIAALSHERHITFSEVPKAFLDRLAQGVPHQGVGAQVALKPTLALDDLPGLLESAPLPLLYILDGIHDPHNLGAVLRVADATGATAVVIPERGATGLTAVVAKASAGAIEYVSVVRVVNLAQALNKIKEAGVFVFAADPGASQLYTEVDWTGPSAIVIGGEGAGVRPLIQSRADGLVRLPMLGKISSLNASNAASVIGFEAVRQRMRQSSVLTRI